MSAGLATDIELVITFTAVVIAFLPPLIAKERLRRRNREVEAQQRATDEGE
jgi:hypothetical protein